MIIESICANCGNKKLFEESNIGRTYKCSNCQLPVKIELISLEESSIQRVIDDSLSDEIVKAKDEIALAKSAKELQNELHRKRTERDKTTDLYIGIAMVVIGAALLVSYTLLGICLLIGGFFFLRRSTTI